ncbi:MAG: N-acetylmuramoyl-L-alanine amidase [Ruminococcus sp.]
MQSDRQPTSRKNARRVRYDRILAVLLILILLIVLLVKCCSGCSSSKKKKQEEAATTTTEATEPTTEEQNYSNVVYLSPSNQADNEFTVGDTNEAAECRIIAQKTAAILQQSGLTVMIASETDSLEDKTAMGDNGLAAYVAIHTNAGTGVGTDCYYNSASEASKALAQAVYDPVAALTPTSDRGLMDGSQNGSDSYQYEIGANKSPCCLIEVEFHDGPNVAQWILDNEDNIANAIATGICNYLQVAPASGTVGGTSAVGGDAAAAATTTVSQNAIQDQLSAGN